MNENDRDIELAMLERDLELLRKEIELTINSINRWQQEQDDKISGNVRILDDLTNRLNILINKVDVIEARQFEYVRKVEKVNDETKEFKNYLIESQRNNKAIWIPVVFSLISTIIGVILPLLMK